MKGLPWVLTLLGSLSLGKQHPSQRIKLFFKPHGASFRLYSARMKKPSILLALTGAVALCGALLLPQPSSGQSPAAGDAALTQLLTEITAQQATILDNHAKIDEKIAAIAEDVRVARIFVGRGGGKTK